MERIVQRRVEYFLESQFKLGESQYGFRQEKSTMDALLIVHNTVRQAIDNGKFCIVVHLDIQGAYDYVWHDGLLFKMIELGVDRQTMNWIRSYLSDRKIKVTLGCCSSNELPVQCGVPQGAVLSPVLFNIMLNDLPYDENIKLVSYADDVTLTVVADNLDDAMEHMQSYLDTLYEWFTNWHFTLSPAKCSSQLFTRRRHLNFYNFHLNGSEIPNEQNKKLLGVIFDAPKLNFNAHVLYLKDSCNRRTNILKAIGNRHFGCTRNTLRRIYIAFIQSKMEYACPILGRLSNKNIKILEVVQNKSLRIILGSRQTSPILSLQVESFVPPVHMRFQFLTLRWRIKLAFRGSYDNTLMELKLDQRAELSQSEFAAHSNSAAELYRMHLPNLTRTEIVSPFPPWVNLYDDINLELPFNLNSIGTTVQENFTEYISEIYPEHINIYTDGSKLETGSTSAAYFVPSLKIAESFLLNPSRTVIGSELFAIWRAIQYANSNYRFVNKRVLVLTDSRSALQMIAIKHKPNYKHIIFNIQKEIKNSHTASFKFQWVKSHCGIKYNDVVDLLAKRAHSSDRSSLIVLEKDELMANLRNHFLSHWTRYWKSEVLSTQTGSFLSRFVERPSFRPWLCLKNRSIECTLNRFRLGHVGVHTHMFRFEMEGSGYCSVCNTPETIEHLWLHCDKHEEARNCMIVALDALSVPFSLRNVLSAGEFDKKTQRKILKIISQFIQSINNWTDL